MGGSMGGKTTPGTLFFAIQYKVETGHLTERTVEQRVVHYRIALQELGNSPEEIEENQPVTKPRRELLTKPLSKPLTKPLSKPLAGSEHKDLKNLGMTAKRPLRRCLKKPLSLCCRQQRLVNLSACPH
jgi:hypothetical protein